MFHNQDLLITLTGSSYVTYIVRSRNVPFQCCYSPPRDLPGCSFFVNKKTYLRNIHCPTDMPYYVHICCRVCGPAPRLPASPAQFVLLISHPCSNVMQCKENFFMIVRSYTTDYGLVKINMIIFLNYFQFSPDTSAWWSELLRDWPVLRLHSRKPLPLPGFPVNMP